MIYPHLVGSLFSALAPLSFGKHVRNNVRAEYSCNLVCMCTMLNEALKANRSIRFNVFHEMIVRPLETICEKFRTCKLNYNATGVVQIPVEDDGEGRQLNV